MPLSRESAAALIGGPHEETPEEKAMATEPMIKVKVISAYYDKGMKIRKEGEKLSLPAGQASDLISTNRAVLDVEETETKADETKADDSKSVSHSPTHGHR
jgi:hypothetical protein